MAKCYEYRIKVTRDFAGVRRELVRVLVRSRRAAAHVVLAEAAKLNNHAGDLIGVELLGVVPREWGKPADLVKAARRGVDALRDGAADGGGC
jgi:hypothetical protein